MRRERYPSYEKRFANFSRSVEKWLLTACITLLICLVLSQILLHIDTFRVWFVEVEKLEGVAS